MGQVCIDYCGLCGVAVLSTAAASLVLKEYQFVARRLSGKTKATPPILIIENLPTDPTDSTDSYG